MKYKVLGTGMYACTMYVFVFLLSSWIVLPLGPLHVFFLSQNMPVLCRSERDIADKHTAQHRATGSAPVALDIIKSLVAPNHGPLLSAAFTFCCILPCASVAGGVSRPRSGALVQITVDAA